LLTILLNKKRHSVNLVLPNAVELKPLNPIINGLLPSPEGLLITKENLHLLKEESALLKE
jgi:hypothetical protein